MARKHYRFPDECSPLGGGTTYVETQDGKITLRQITVFNDQILASNIKHPLYGFNLTDQPVEYDKIKGIEPIGREEFDRHWEKVLAHHASSWRTAKRMLRPGARVEGYIEIFYPQGVIVNVGSKFMGLADYEACRVSTTPEHLYPGHKLEAVVRGYDEGNLWFQLDAPRVYPQIIAGDFQTDPGT